MNRVELANLHIFPATLVSLTECAIQHSGRHHTRYHPGIPLLARQKHYFANHMCKKTRQRLLRYD